MLRELFDTKLVNGSNFNKSRFQLRILYFLKETKHVYKMTINMYCLCTIKYDSISWQYIRSKSNGNIFFIKKKQQQQSMGVILNKYESLWSRFKFHIEMVSWHDKRGHQCVFDTCRKFPTHLGTKKNYGQTCREHIKCLCESSEARKCHFLAEIFVEVAFYAVNNENKTSARVLFGFDFFFCSKFCQIFIIRKYKFPFLK